MKSQVTTNMPFNKTWSERKQKLWIINKSCQEVPQQTKIFVALINECLIIIELESLTVVNNYGPTLLFSQIGIQFYVTKFMASHAIDCHWCQTETDSATAFEWKKRSKVKFIKRRKLKGAHTYTDLNPRVKEKWL